jgi:hypothetical protein
MLYKLPELQIFQWKFKANYSSNNSAELHDFEPQDHSLILSWLTLLMDVAHFMWFTVYINL